MNTPMLGACLCHKRGSVQAGGMPWSQQAVAASRAIRRDRLAARLAAGKKRCKRHFGGAGA